jgi:hypothetical protein
MTSSALTRLGLALGLVGLLASAAGGPTPAVAASPAASPDPSVAPSTGPSASPVTDPGFPLEAWLDRAAPTAAAPGTNVPIGVTIWDRTARRLAPAQSLHLWWYPATGDGPPTQATIAADWSGHGIATIAVPQGGGGRLGLTFPGTACASDGCAPTESLFPIAGVGPPPDAPLPQVASAEIQPGGAITAGRPTQVAVVLRPKAAWEPGSFTMPSRLFLQARIPRGATLASVPATLADAAEGRYLATITLPEPGQYILEVAATVDSQGSGSFEASTARITAIPAEEVTPAPTSGSGEGSDDSGLIVPAVLLLVAVALLGGLVLVVRRSS